MQRNLVVIACVMLALAAGACNKDEQVTHFGPPPGLLPTSTPSFNPSSTSTATSSTGASATPGIVGNMRTGGASVITAGGVNATLTLTKLDAPALWTPPPGDISLRWTGAGQASLSLVGPAFTSRQPTSATVTLSFSIPGSESAAFLFISSAGECFVTISAAMPDQMSGIFDCGTLASSDGKVTVTARGTFTASG
jgi:hypothetical protein